MSRDIRTPADIKARSRALGMVQAAPGDVEARDRALPARDSARDRVAAEVMRRNGFDTRDIEAKFGYVPGPVTAKSDAETNPGMRSVA